MKQIKAKAQVEMKVETKYFQLNQRKYNDTGS
jgi:hypothetical protein